MLAITSASNAKYKYIKSLYLKKNRQKYKEYTVEGIKSVNDALKSKQHVSMIAVSESFLASGTEIPDNIETLLLSDFLFERLCETGTPQGILAVIKMNRGGDFKADTSKGYVYCDNISDPGNLGTVIRTADAAGMGAVLLSPGCADLYSPKTVRASMGSFFNIETIADFSHERLLDMKKEGFSLIGGALGENSVDYRSADYKAPAVIIVGNEANGISEELLLECRAVKIPILGSAESLNAAVAAGILMYEFVRNRS
ncbi:MAG: RNA methyltransferase [Clostridiales bacterium]|nr:RNA methyltransferase [Clostridiales bacterium]